MPSLETPAPLDDDGPVWELLTVVGLPAAIVATSAALRLRSNLRHRQVKEWAVEQGLVAWEDGLLRGRLDEMRVELGAVARKRMVIRVLIRPALDLGLRVQPRRWPVPPKLVWVDSRDAEFEQALSCYGRDAGRTASLLSPALLQAMRTLTWAGEDALLSDDCLSIWLAGSKISPEFIKPMLVSARAVLAELEGRRGQVPVSPLLEPFLPAWRSLAQARGLELYQAPLGLLGTFKGRQVCAVAVELSERSHLLDVLAWFEPPLPFALSVKPRPADKRRRRAPPGGAADFAGAFEVEQADERGQLLLAGGIDQELAKTQERHGPVTLTSEWLWVRVAELPADPQVALDVMDAVAELGHEIALGARQLVPDAGGPYRGRQ